MGNDKPLLVARQQFIDELVSMINNSGLPPVIMLPIIEGVYKELSAVLENQIAQEKEAYDKAYEEKLLKEGEANAENNEV